MTDTTQQFEYPTTARRAFVNLSEAVRVIGDGGKEVRRMLEALAGIHVSEEIRAQLTEIYLNNRANDREPIAEGLALLLDGHEKFDSARFIHHATSGSTADDDSDEGKWSYNRTHQAEAQKTTIEGFDGLGEGETVVL